MEGERGLCAEWNIQLAQRFITVEAAVDAPEHHVDFGVLKVEAEKHQRGSHLLLGNAHGLLLLGLRSTPSGGRRRLRRGWPRHGKHTENFKPGPAIHKVQ